MSNTSALVSVIMPVYNVEKFVAQSIMSLLRQSYTNWELLVINDGSTDKTKEKIMSFSDNRIKYYEQENKGVSAARNVGLANMQGDFFCFLDGDDIYPINSIESRFDVFVHGLPDLEFVDGRVEERDISMKNIFRIYIPTYTGNPLEPMLRLSESCYLGQTWLIKRKKGRVYSMREDFTHGEDFYFLLELGRDGGLYDYTTDTILLYRKHSSSAMSNLDGLNRGYLQVHSEIKNWPEVTFWQGMFFWLKSRKIMFLSYLVNGRSAVSALRSLFQYL